MTQELSDEVLSMEELIFNDHIDGQTYNQIMDKYKISKRQVGNLITKARETIYNRLMDTGRRYFAEVWMRYDYIYRIAQDEYNNNRNPLFLKEMRACLEAQRRLLGLDAAPKASVNQIGDAVPNQLIIVMNPTAYEQKEKQVAEIIDGNVKVIK